MTHFLSTKMRAPLTSCLAAGHLNAAFKPLVTGALLMGLIVTTACGSAPASATAPNANGLTPMAEVRKEAQKVTIAVGDNFSFDPAAITVRAGQPVELTLQ